jgi:metallo-beta-lactamase family protein
VDITFIGAARTVTGSLHLLEYNNQKFLLECGLYQGHREDAERINRTFAFKPKDIKAVILSHAHIDHSGNLPNLTKRGFSGPIFCTSATRDIVSLLLLDSAKIQQYDIEYLNKKNKKAGLPLKEPLYTVKDAEQTIDYLSPIDYAKTFEPVKGVKATLFDAGHILGSSVILLEADGKKLLFSGDLGRKNMPIIRDPTVVKDIDYMILESTYGGRTHKSFKGMTDEFREIIKKGEQDNGKIIIPAFAVERTQVLVTMLKDLYEDGSLKNIPVYIDSPLATSVTEVFRDHPECFDKETYQTFMDSDPFDFPGLNYIKDTEESKSLNSQNRPMIIMSASGMCEGGRVTHHLIHSIENNKNSIVITGFQARGTLGRKILEGAEKVWIFNSEYDVRAKVYFMGGLSAHADSNDLVTYVKNCSNGRLKKIFLIHGDLDEAYALQNEIQNSQGIDVDIPQSMTRVRI